MKDDLNIEIRDEIPFHLLSPWQAEFMQEYFGRGCCLLTNEARNVLHLSRTGTLYEYINSIRSYPQDGRINISEYTFLSETYNEISDIVSALTNNEISANNFDKRCNLLCRLIQLNKAKIDLYFDDRALKFDLFKCLYDIIFGPFEKGLSFENKELLHYRMNLSNAWQQENFYVMKEQIHMSTNVLQHAERYLERRIDKIISRFIVVDNYIDFGLEAILAAKSAVPNLSEHFISKVTAILHH